MSNNPKSLVIANNDIVYLWWTYPTMIKNCLGFSIHRIVNGVEEPKGLFATVGFDAVQDKRKSPQTTDEWPIQSFNWKDVYAPTNVPVRYKIIPMIMINKNWKNLTPDLAQAITTDPISRNQQYGDVRIIFNRGLLSTQAFSKSSKKSNSTPTDKLLSASKKLITDPKSIWRKRLAGQMLMNIKEFFDLGKAGGKFYCCLYELTDEELINHLLACKKPEIILSNANGTTEKTVNGKKKSVTVVDKTNKAARTKLHKAMKSGTLKVYDRILKSNSIGHNKFVIYEDAHGKPRAVLTGSTNWTATGLCGQTNNMVIIHSDKVADQYLEYWNELKKDVDQQGAVLRTWCGDSGETTQLKNNTHVTLWYSPNTDKKTKPKVITAASTPVDMNEVFNLIKQANKQVFYLVFNPGSPSIIDVIKNAATAKLNAGNPLFVRGAVSEAKIAKGVTTNIVSRDILFPPDVYKVTGVAAIPGRFSYWEKELLKFGFATIHDKILVIDPFDEQNCAVVTGSHNLGFKASYANDENMLIIKGNTGIAQAYATHVLDVVNHFKWRYKLQNKVISKKGKALTAALESGWHDLDETDQWMDYYYDDHGALEREQLLFY